MYLARTIKAKAFTEGAFSEEFACPNGTRIVCEVRLCYIHLVMHMDYNGYG